MQLSSKEAASLVYHEEDIADVITDIIWSWLTLVAIKVRRKVQQARRKRENP